MAQLNPVYSLNPRPGHGAGQPPVTNLAGKLVSLGPLRRDWIPHYQRWLNDFEMIKLVDRRFRPQTEEKITAWYERHVSGATDALVFTIIANDDDRPIGNIALQDIDYRNRTAELGVYIGDAEFRGNGYGTEATLLLTSFAFGVLGFNNIMLRVYEYNQQAIRAYQKAGFIEIGRRHQSQFMNGRFWDTIFMERVASDSDVGGEDRLISTQVR
jgi:RimJ/RimL family protein N-acetyltransferase